MGFENAARDDSLVLYHWSKVKSDPQQSEYPFAKFNKKIEVMEYSENEYEDVIRKIGIFQ